jgi:hypothetical protein
MLVGIVAERAVQRWRLKALLVEVARYEVGSADREFPEPHKLCSLAKLKWEPNADESGPAYLDRVFPDQGFGPLWPQD